MKINVAVEGDSDRELVRKLLTVSGHAPMKIMPAGGVTRLDSKVAKYAEAARHPSSIPWLVLRDSDGGCPIELRESLVRPTNEHPRFMLRIAVTMGEAWLMGDPSTFSDFFRVRSAKIPHAPEDEAHAKRSLLAVVATSSSKAVREAMIHESNAQRPGPLYPTKLNEYARKHWNPEVAAERCPSLSRTLNRLATWSVV